MIFENTPFGPIEISENEAHFKRDDLCAPITKRGFFEHPIQGTLFSVVGDALFQEVTKFERVG